MSGSRRPLVAGNWKMNTTGSVAEALAREVATAAAGVKGRVDVMVCPPFPYLAKVVAATSATGLLVGAQNLYFEKSGAFTGEVSAEMLKDVGCTSVLIGHSERRHVLGETDAVINKKVHAAVAAGLQAVLCVGELLSEREAFQTEEVLDRQLDGGLAGMTAASLSHVVIAYEPVWAIGTGKTASPEQAQAAHANLRKRLAVLYDANVAQAMRILYGGSVTAENAQTLMHQADVDGALVGGASLTAAKFLPIIQAAAG